MQIRNQEIINLPKAGGQMAKGKFSLPDLTFHSASNLTNNISIKKRPLNQYSRELSFKGLSLKSVKVDNYKNLLEKVRTTIGSTFEDDFNELVKSGTKRLKVTQDSVEFFRKPMYQMVGEGIIYPFTGMLADLSSFVLSGLKKVPGLKGLAQKAYDTAPLKSRREKMALESKFNGVMGFFEQVNQKMQNGNLKGIAFDDWVMQLAHKSYKPTTGKYSSVHERPLNRIVSGGIPAFFLANDAYNLSSYCDDNSDMAKKEYDIRFNQEVARVGVTAYINFILLSGLTKFVNQNMLGTALSSTIPVIVAETSSRLMNGKSITFISKDKAREMAKENGIIQLKNDGQKNDVIYKYYSMPVAFARAEKTFMSFKGAIDNTAFKSFSNDKLLEATAGVVSRSIAKRDKENGKGEKGLITLNSILKATALSIAGGYSFVFARKKIAAFDIAAEKFFSYFKEGYKKLFTKDFVISKDEFNKIVNKVKETQPELAQSYERIMKRHQDDLQELKKYLEEFNANKDPEKFEKLLGRNEAQEKERKYLKKFNINPYTLKQDLNSHLNALNSIPENAYVMDKVNKKYKPFGDFVISPFGFMWSAVKLPYTIVSRVIGMLGKQKSKGGETSIRTLTNVVSDYQNTLNKKSKLNFDGYLRDGLNRSADNTTKSSYDNADLGKVQKLLCSAITTWFLIADDHNMVMMKSLGEDEEGAKLKAKERAQQRIAGIFYQTMFIDLFNNTFRAFYNASLMGMSVVTAMCTLVCEVFTRKSIGKPVGRMSRDEINELEYKNNTAPGLKGKYFRFMSQLTGKKAVSADALKKQQKKEAKANA